MKLNSVTRPATSAKSIVWGRYDQICGCQSKVCQLHFEPSGVDLCLIDLFPYKGNYNNQAVMTQKHGSLSLTLEMTKKLLAFDSNLNWKKLDLTTELICLSNLSAEPKLTPRFLTTVFLQVSRAPKSQSGAPEDPNTMASVLPSFREPRYNRPITRAQCVSAAVKQDQMLNLCLYLESQQMCRGPSEPIHAPKN